MICPSCGINNQNTAINCAKCGFPLVQRQQYIPPQQQITQPPPIIQQPFPIQRMPYQPMKPINPPMGTVPNPPAIPPPLKNVQQQIPQMQQMQQPPPNMPPIEPNFTPLPIGVQKPTFGICSLCNRDMLRFYDNGEGECMNCHRTFSWYNPNANQDSDDHVEEDNPFTVKEDEILPESERKMEVEADSVVYHKASTKKVELDGKVLDLEKISKHKIEMSDEKRLKLLEARFAKGEISEDIYDSLRGKLIHKLMQDLEDLLISGKISEKEFIKKKDDLEF